MSIPEQDYYEKLASNKKKLLSGSFTWEDLPSHIQKRVAINQKVYTLKLHEWVKVGGCEILWDKEATNYMNPSKILLKYPPTERFYQLRNFFVFLQRGYWVYQDCRIPFTDLVVIKWEVGDYTIKGLLLATFIGSIGSGPNVGG